METPAVELLVPRPRLSPELAGALAASLELAQRDPRAAAEERVRRVRARVTTGLACVASSVLVLDLLVLLESR